MVVLFKELGTDVHDLNADDVDESFCSCWETVSVGPGARGPQREGVRRPV